MHGRSEDILGEPDQMLLNHTLIMKLDSKLVEQSGTQRHHWASINRILKADFFQINHPQRFADQISSSRYRARLAQSALCHSEHATIAPPQPETDQPTSIWSSSSTSILPKPRLRRAQQILPGASR